MSVCIVFVTHIEYIYIYIYMGIYVNIYKEFVYFACVNVQVGEYCVYVKCVSYLWECERSFEYQLGGGGVGGTFVYSWPVGLLYVSHILMHFFSVLRASELAARRDARRWFSRNGDAIRFSTHALMQLANPGCRNCGWIHLLVAGGSAEARWRWLRVNGMDADCSRGYCWCGCWSEEEAVTISWAASLVSDSFVGLWISDIIFENRSVVAFRLDFRKKSGTIETNMLINNAFSLLYNCMHFYSIN